MNKKARGPLLYRPFWDRHKYNHPKYDRRGTTSPPVLLSANLRSDEGELDLIFSGPVTFASVPSMPNLKLFTATQQWGAIGDPWEGITPTFATLPVEYVDDVVQSRSLDFNNSSGYIIDKITRVQVPSVSGFTLTMSGVPTANLIDVTLKTGDLELDMIYSANVTFSSVPSQAALLAYSGSNSYVATGDPWTGVFTTSATLPIEQQEVTSNPAELDFDNSSGYIIDFETALPVASVTDFAIGVE